MSDMRLDDGWHTNGEAPGESVMVPMVEWERREPFRSTTIGCTRFSMAIGVGLRVARQEGA